MGSLLTERGHFSLVIRRDHRAAYGALEHYDLLMGVAFAAGPKVALAR